VNSDPEKIITVGDGGVIRVTGKEFGYFATERSYANYRLSFEVKWGEQRWPPRENAVRDSGVLVHQIGEDKVWPQSSNARSRRTTSATSSTSAASRRS
jgi:hypothetical protein